MAGSIPEKGSLALKLEALPSVRSQLLTGPGFFTRWPDAKTVGVKSVKAMSLNADVLEEIAMWWCDAFPHVKILDINTARREARTQDNSTFQRQMLRIPLKVKILRERLGMKVDDELCHLDGNGVKILFNHGIRRFNARTATRDAWLSFFPWMMFFFSDPGKACFDFFQSNLGA